MSQPISIADFFALPNALPMIDVRSPAEFAKGHIPGAKNIALFSNDERAAVGTTYKQQGRQAAILQAFDFTGSKWSSYIKQAEQWAPQKQLLVHCWRGGMRSAAMAWALSLYGFKVFILIGGYKQYRAWARNQFLQAYPLYVLGGNTGTGKTEVLGHLQVLNQQVIDLEGLAHHQGSAYGSMNKLVQPSQEQFENNLAHALYSLLPDKPVWIEDESQMIGRCIVPTAVWQQMRSAPLINLQLATSLRVDRLMKEYGSLDKNFLIECTQRISKRLGPKETRDAIQHIQQNNMRAFIEIILHYYDKQYQKGMSKRPIENVYNIACKEDNCQLHALLLIKFAHQFTQHITPTLEEI